MDLQVMPSLLLLFSLFHILSLFISSWRFKEFKLLLLARSPMCSFLRWFQLKGAHFIVRCLTLWMEAYHQCYCLCSSTSWVIGGFSLFSTSSSQFWSSCCFSSSLNPLASTYLWESLTKHVRLFQESHLWTSDPPSLVHSNKKQLLTQQQ